MNNENNQQTQSDNNQSGVTKPAMKTMASKLKAAGLIGLGAVVGVALSLNFSAIAERQNPTFNLPIDEVRMLSEVYGRIKSDYVEEVDDKRLIKEAINGMLTGLDPHSAFLDADAFKEMQSVTTGKFGGLGIEVGSEDGLVKVISPIDDTPAFKAGIKSGDYIIKVDDTSLRGLNLNDAVKKMRGEAGTEAVITILRKGENKELVFNVRRAEIQLQSVRARDIEPGIAYIRLAQFEDATADKMVKYINDAYKQNNGNLKGMVLDLRNDPGGLLHASVAVSAAFLPKDALVVYTEGRVEDAKLRFSARKEDYVRGSKREDPIAKLNPATKNVPLVVLVNNGSASASEIVAGALQDHKRATIIGTRSFGKGSVQTILPLTKDTAIKLTTARYLTPNGRAIQAKGITPDMIVDDGLQRLSMYESDLEHHLSSDEERKAAEDAKRKAGAPATASALTPADLDKLKGSAKSSANIADTKNRASLAGLALNAKATANQGEVIKLADDDKPIEYKPLNGADGKPVDFVLQQALNYLKGVPVAANPRELLVAANPGALNKQGEAIAKMDAKIGAKIEGKIEPKTDTKTDAKVLAK